MKKIAIRLLKIAIIVYLLVGIGLYFFQEKLLFHPTVLAQDYVFNLKDSFTEQTIRYDSSTSYHLIKFHTATACKGVVLYFHGNRGNIIRYQRFVKNFTKNGYEVWMMDYPGFGKSTGLLNEQMLYEEALQLYKMAKAIYQPGQIIIYGKSLGTGIAAQLASRRDCRRLILETPYYDIVSAASNYAWMYPLSWMVKYNIPTHLYLQKVTAPVTIFHGTSDEVISYSSASKLKAVLKKGDEFITLDGGNHRNLNSFPLMQQKLDSLLSLK